MVIERFLAFVPQRGDGCWEWTGFIAPKGYGQFRWVHAGRRTWQAHRAAWLLFVGEVPPGLEIDHTCNNRICVNPRHLEAVTHAENVRRGHARRKSTTHCSHGHAFAEVGAYIRPSGNRACMECARAARRKYYAAHAMSGVAD